MSSTTVTITNEPPSTTTTPAPDAAATEQRKAEDSHRAKSAEIIKESRSKQSKKRADDGTFASDKPAQTSEPATADLEDDADAAASTDKPVVAAEEKKPDKPATHDKAKFETAMKALLTDGTFSAEELATLPPEVIIAKGEKAKKRQNDVDKAWQERQNAFGELETLKSKLAEFESAKGNPPASGAGTKAETSETATSLQASVQALTTKIKDTIGDDLDLQSEFDSLAQGIIAASKPDLSGVESLKAQFEAMIDSHSRDKIVERFSELSDDSAWKNIQGKASALVKSGLSPDREQALMSAAAMEYGLAAAEKAAQRAKAIDKAKQNGQPYSGRQTNENTPAAKAEDASKQFLKQRRRELESQAK